jgi:hypothetical protein
MTMRDREPWHLSDEAVYDYLDRILSPSAMADAARHLRSCPECAGRLRRATLLFSRIESAEVPGPARDFSAGVVASLQAARMSRRRWSWILLAEASAAAAALMALSLRLEGWFDALLHHSAYQSLREHGLRLMAEGRAWLAPFFGLVPASASRLASVRIVVPHLEGPVLGWAGLAVAALTLGLVGNMLLLHAANGHAVKEPSGANARGGAPVRPGGRSIGGRR